jgi:hypothetical protein
MPLAFAWVIWISICGCGDSFSSLDTVGEYQVYSMQIFPNTARWGDILMVTVTEVGPELDAILRSYGFAYPDRSIYPTMISLGEGTYIRSYGYDKDEHLVIEVYITPLATTGERELIVDFGFGAQLATGLGSFLILAEPTAG